MTRNLLLQRQRSSVVRAGVSPAPTGHAHRPDRLREDTTGRAHGPAAATACRHDQLPRRSDQFGSRRALHGHRWRRGVDRRAADQGRQGRSHLLSGRGGGGTPRFARHPAFADRSPSRSLSGPRRRGRRRTRSLHARVFLQPRVPQFVEGTQAVVPSTLRDAADALPSARAGGRGDRRRGRHRTGRRPNDSCSAQPRSGPQTKRSTSNPRPPVCWSPQRS